MQRKDISMKRAIRWFLYILFFFIGIAAEDTNNALLKASNNDGAKEVIIEQLNDIAESNYIPKITFFDDYSTYYNCHYEYGDVDGIEIEILSEIMPEEDNVEMKSFKKNKISEAEFYAEVELDEIEVNGTDLSLEYLNSRDISIEVEIKINIPTSLNLG